MNRQISPSRRIARIQAPVIPDIGALLRAHPEAISLGQGVPSYGPPTELVQAATALEHDPARHRYQAGDGMAELLEVWRRVLQQDNAIPADAGDMLVTAGSNMAFLQLVAVIADPGDQVLLPSPYFFNQRMALETLGVEPLIVPTLDNYQLDLGRIEGAITSKTRAIVTVSPNNPTGAVYSAADLTYVNRLCADKGLLHISDEAYQHFVYGDAAHFSPASLAGAAEHTISLFSMSKSYGMSGWRIGAALVPSSLMQDLRKIQDTNLICAPVPSQRLAAHVLASGAEWLTARIAEMASLREQVLQGLDALDSPMEVPRTRGAFYFLLRLPFVAPDMPIAERLVREFGVALIPGSAFGAGPTVHLRLAYGALAPDTIDEAMSRLGQGLRAITTA